MNKLQESVLDIIRDKNNEYRNFVLEFKKNLEDCADDLLSKLSSLSNYSIDYSDLNNTINKKLINEISSIIDSYVIKDLRNVESVNVQFKDKINDKIDGAVLDNENDKLNFINNLKQLLEDKYLEIVKIKRTEFFDYNDNENTSVEEAVNAFTEELNSKYALNEEKYNELINNFKASVYDAVRTMFASINNLYLNVFVNEIINSLNDTKDINQASVIPTQEDDLVMKPEKEVTPIVPEVPEVPEVPDVPEEQQAYEEVETQIPTSFEVPLPDDNDINTDNMYSSFDVPLPPNNELEEAQAPTTFEVPLPDDTEIKVDEDLITPEVPLVSDIEPTGMDIPDINTIEVSDNKANHKKTYDVDEILKIAKSPILSFDENKNNIEDKDGYIPVTPLKQANEDDIIDTEFNAEEIVGEMVRRLTKRFENIKSKQLKIEEEEKKILDDEIFVNELIENSRKKKEELDNMEEELKRKEEELNQKKTNLEKKINEIMPLANAILKNE